MFAQLFSKIAFFGTYLSSSHTNSSNQDINLQPSENGTTCSFLPTFHAALPDDYNQFCGGIIKSGFDQGIRVIINGEAYIQRTIVIQHQKNENICLDLLVEHSETKMIYETEPVILHMIDDVHVIDVAQTFPRSFNLRASTHDIWQYVGSDEHNCRWWAGQTEHQRDHFDRIQHFATQHYDVEGTNGIEYMDSFYWMNRGEHLFHLETDGRTSTVSYNISLPRRHAYEVLSLTEGVTKINSSLLAAPALVEIKHNGHDGLVKSRMVAAQCDKSRHWVGFEMLDEYCLYNEPNGFWKEFWSPSLDFEPERDYNISQGQPCLHPHSVTMDWGKVFKKQARINARNDLLGRPRGDLSRLRRSIANDQFDSVFFSTNGQANDRIVAKGSHLFTFETTLQLRSKITQQHVQEGFVESFNCTLGYNNHTLICSIIHLSRAGNVRFQMYTATSCTPVWTELIHVEYSNQTFSIPLYGAGVSNQRDYRICTAQGECIKNLVTIRPDTPYFPPLPPHTVPHDEIPNPWTSIIGFFRKLWYKLQWLWITLLVIAGLVGSYFVFKFVSLFISKKRDLSQSLRMTRLENNIKEAELKAKLDKMSNVSV